MTEKELQPLNFLQFKIIFIFPGPVADEFNPEHIKIHFRLKRKVEALHAECLKVNI